MRRIAPLLLIAMAAASAEASAASAPPRRRVHRTKDGSTFVWDASTNSWRLETQPKPEVPEAKGAPVAALPWAQFNVSFTGDFLVAGEPLLLGPKQSLRTEDQQDGDTGRSIWDGAVALAKLLERNPQLVAGREVLEVGAGRGVVGISAARLGARRVVATDLEYCLEGLRADVARNGLGPGEPCDAACSAEPGRAVGGSAVEVAELDWSRPERFFQRERVRDGEDDFDVVLAADVTWLLELVHPLAAALAAVCSRHPRAEVLVVHQTRSTNVEVTFLEAMADSFELAWELRGGVDPAVAGSPAAESGSSALPAEPSAPSFPGVAWHPDYTPDARVRLWCFRPRPGRAGQEEGAP